MANALRVGNRSTIVLAFTMAFMFAVQGGASDGRVEINHAGAIAGGVVPGDTPGYPVNLGSMTGSFVLTSNLLPPSDQSAIHNSPGADGPVNIDLNGFHIRQQNAASITEGIQLFGRGNSVVNGSVAGGPTCVDLEFSTAARVESLELRDCGFGITTGPNSVIRRNRVIGSSNVGINSTGSIVSENIIQQSTVADLLCSGCVRRDNLCSDSTCAPERRFYLTNFAVHGGGALTACGLGFHMASMSELRDHALRYDPILGDDTRADLGQGAPSILFGWVRNGYISTSGSGSTGFNNCNAWTQGTSGSGTAIFLNPVTTTSATTGSPWVASNFACNTPLPTWCVED